MTKDDLKTWYAQEYGKTLGDGNSNNQINSLVRCGLLAERGDSVKCTFPSGRDQEKRNREVIKIIDRHVVFILEMLRLTRRGVTYKEICGVDEKKHRLGIGKTKNQISWRLNWLLSTGMLEKRKNPAARASLWAATELGKRVLDEESATPRFARSRAVNPAEFSGEGEGPEHKSLKGFVHQQCEAVLRVFLNKDVKLADSQMEYKLRSGDSVDVTAWNCRHVWHIEVKSKISKDADLERGVYQCIKYQAVGEAMEEEADSRRVETMLVVEKEPSADIMKLANRRGVSIHPLSRDMRRQLAKMRKTSG